MCVCVWWVGGEELQLVKSPVMRDIINERTVLGAAQSAMYVTRSEERGVGARVTMIKILPIFKRKLYVRLMGSVGGGADMGVEKSDYDASRSYVCSVTFNMCSQIFAF